MNRVRILIILGALMLVAALLHCYPLQFQKPIAESHPIQKQKDQASVAPRPEPPPVATKSSTRADPVFQLDSQINAIEHDLKDNDSLARLRADHLPPDERAKTIAMLRRLMVLRSQELDWRMDRIQSELAKRRAR